MMYAHELSAIRKILQVTQTTMADELGVEVRTLQKLEGEGRLQPQKKVRRVLELAISRVLIDFAIKNRDPKLLGGLRSDLQNLIMEDFHNLVIATAKANKKDGEHLSVVSKAA